VCSWRHAQNRATVSSLSLTPTWLIIFYLMIA
jgi:hypothetical protein